MDKELQKEITGLKNDKILTKLVLDQHKCQMAEMLNGELGKDIHSVLSGEIKVKLTLKERIKYKIRGFFDTIFRYF